MSTPTQEVNRLTFQLFAILADVDECTKTLSKILKGKESERLNEIKRKTKRTKAHVSAVQAESDELLDS